jgi:hypothetical protein
MYCPNCGAEYRPDFATCADCQVALVADPPTKRAKSAAVFNENEEDQHEFADDSEHDSFVLVWSGMDPRGHADARAVLADENIPARTIHHQDHLIYAAVSSPFEIYVPAAMAGQAKHALKAANASEESLDQLAESGALEIPADDDEDPDGNVLIRSTIAKRARYAIDDDAQEVTVWTGEDSDIAHMIEASLRENGIASSVTSEAAATSISVHPEDEPRAQEIIREITDATPPN